MAVEKFLKRVEAANKSRSKEIRMTIAEAQELAFQLSSMLAKENTLLTKVIALQENKDNPLTVQDMKNAFAEVSGTGAQITGVVAMDGGDFKS